MNKENLTTPPIFSEKLTVHSEIDGLLEIDGSSPGPAGIAALDLGGELLERKNRGFNWDFDLSIDFARPKKLTNIVIDKNSLNEYRGLFELLIGSERVREASESFQRNDKNLEPKKISKSEQSMFWATTSPFSNYVLAESRAENNQSGDIRELFARIESFASLDLFADSVERQDRYQAARNVRDIQRSKDRNLEEILGDLRSQVSEIVAEDDSLLLILKSQLGQFSRQEMSDNFRVTKLLRELHLQIESQAERVRLSGAFIDQDKKLSGSVREIRNRGFFSDLGKYFVSPFDEQQSFFEGEEIFLQENKVERNLDTLQVFFISPLLVGKWVRVIDRDSRTPVALAEIVPNRQGAIAEICLPFQARVDDYRLYLTSDPLQAKDQPPLTVRIRAIREGQIAAQRERAGDFIGASWHWLHCSNLWKIIDETPTANTAARWAKSCFEKSSKVTEDRDYKRPPRPRLSPRPDLLLHSMSLPSFGFDDIEESAGLSSRGSDRRNVKAKKPSKTTFLTDTAWSVLDDLGL